MSAALQVYYAAFDAVLFKLPPALRARIEGKIDEVGLRLSSFPHERLKGSDRSRLRVGDYPSFTPSILNKIQFICWR